MILYHFTSGYYLRGIARYGLTVGDVPTDIPRWEGRVGVWLTSNDAPMGHGLEGSALDKKRYRLSVETDRIAAPMVKWSEWAPRNVTRETIEVLHSTAGGFESWYVVHGIVPVTVIIGCVDMATGQEVVNWQEHLPVEESHAGVPAWRREAWFRQTIKGAKRTVASRRAA